MGLIITILNLVFNIYMFAIIIRFFVTCLLPDFYNQFIQIVIAITDIAVIPVRNWWYMMPIAARFSVDVSPIFTVILVYIVKLLVLKGVGFLIG